MTPSAEFIRTTHLSQFEGGLKNQYQIVLIIVKTNFFKYFMRLIKTLKNWNDCIIFCYKKNLEISFENWPGHETTSLRGNTTLEL